jgi:hypothetical protein
MTLLHRLLALALATGVFTLSADTVQLRDGRRVDGTFMGGDTRQVKLLGSDGKLQTFEISDVETISFKAAPAAASNAAASSPSASPAPVPPASRTAAARASAPSAARVTVPAGAVLTVRLIDGVDSDVNQTGERFRASLDQPLQVGEEVVAPRGADVTVQLVRVEQSGKLSGRDEVALDVYDITINGKKYQVATSYAEVESASRTNQTAKVAGGLAALGAIVGAVAGGGKGAAVGAVSGAGAGTAVQVLTKGARVKIPSESRLEFTLKQPLVVN